jgi:fructose-specific phosphotransferase system IIA component
MPFVKTAVYEVIVRLNDSIQKLKDSSDPHQMRKELLDGDGRTSANLLSLITPQCISIDLKGETKEEIVTELVEILSAQNKLLNKEASLKDVLDREKIMSTGMQHGIALPHAKTDGVSDLAVAVGIKKGGVDFESADGEKSRIFILLLSPKKTSGPHIQFLAAIGTVLKDDDVRKELIEAQSKERVVMLLQKGKIA